MVSDDKGWLTVDALLSELVKRAATENSAMVEPVGRTDSQPSGPGKAATLAFLGGLGADVGTTAYGSLSGKTTEANPLVKWAGNKGAAPAVAGMGMGTLLLSKLIGKSHPTIAKALLYGMGGAHGAAALSNIHQMGNQPQVQPTTSMKQSSDGAWYDPAYFPTLGK